MLESNYSRIEIKHAFLNDYEEKKLESNYSRIEIQGCSKNCIGFSELESNYSRIEIIARRIARIKLRKVRIEL